MQIVINGKNVEITDQLRSYIEKKVTKLDRFLPNIGEARVDLASQSTRSAGDREVVQLTLHANGTVLRAEERSSDMQAALDIVMDRMTRQIERYKGKHWRSLNRTQARDMAAPAEPESEYDLVRVKKFETHAMTVDEAIEQMELLGHDFFAFYEVGENMFSVIYKRRDGGYGLLQPELA